MLVSWMFKVKTSPFPSSSCVGFEFVVNKSDFRIFCYSSVDSDIRSLCFVLVFLRWFSVFVLVLNLWRRRGGSTTLRTASKRLNTCDSHQLLHLRSIVSNANKGSPAAFKLQASFTSRFLIVLTCVNRPHLGLGHFAVPSSLPRCLCYLVWSSAGNASPQPRFCSPHMKNHVLLFCI